MFVKRFAEFWVLMITTVLWRQETAKPSQNIIYEIVVSEIRKHVTFAVFLKLSRKMPG
jgi:hypothetical protein